MRLRRPVLRIISLIGITTWLIACGGGGGGPASSSGPASINGNTYIATISTGSGGFASSGSYKVSFSSSTYNLVGSGGVADSNGTYSYLNGIITMEDATLSSISCRLNFASETSGTYTCSGPSNSGQSGTFAIEGVTSVSLLERNFNGDILKSEKKYNPSGTLLSTTTHTIDKISNIITVSYSDWGGKDYYYYNSGGQIVKLAVIDELDPDINGNYSSNSRELYYTYNALGLLSGRTRDRSIDGDIDSRQTWEYDTNGKLVKRLYDDDNDGFSDIVTTYTWSNGQKLTRVQTESDGSSTTFNYSYPGNSILPTGRSEDINSDGSIEWTLTYAHDANGNQILFSIFNQSGALDSYWVYEYESAGGEIVENLQLRNWNAFY
jgi:hypothetical protein